MGSHVALDDEAVTLIARTILGYLEPGAPDGGCGVSWKAAYDAWRQARTSRCMTRVRAWLSGHGLQGAKAALDMLDAQVQVHDFLADAAGTTTQTVARGTKRWLTPADAASPDMTRTPNGGPPRNQTLSGKTFTQHPYTTAEQAMWARRNFINRGKPVTLVTYDSGLGAYTFGELAEQH